MASFEVRMTCKVTKMHDRRGLHPENTLVDITLAAGQETDLISELSLVLGQST